MHGVIRTHITAFDSSQLGMWARDKFSKNEAYRSRAIAFERAFEAKGYVLLLCYDHIQELLSHNDENVINDRINFITSFPLIATINSYIADDIAGSTIDLQTHEVATAFKNSKASVSMIRDEVANTLFRFCSGRELIRPFLQNWSILKARFAQSAHRRREIVAISQSGFVDCSDQSVMDLLRGQVRNLEDMKLQLLQLERDLACDIEQRGDRRIPSPARSSAEFLEEVRRWTSDVIGASNGSYGVADILVRVLTMIGIAPHEVGAQTTIGDLGDWAVFRKKLAVVNRTLSLPWWPMVTRVTEDRLPSGVIQSVVRRFQPDTRERKGSDLMDGYLASLSAYADLTYVDKRTHEAFREGRQKSKQFRALIRQVEKTQGYEHLVAQ